MLQQITSKSSVDIHLSCSAKKYIFPSFLSCLQSLAFLVLSLHPPTPVSNSHLFILQNSSTPAITQTSLPHHQRATISEPWDQQDPLSLESNLGNIFYYKNMPLEVWTFPPGDLLSYQILCSPWEELFLPAVLITFCPLVCVCVYMYIRMYLNLTVYALPY